MLNVHQIGVPLFQDLLPRPSERCFAKGSQKTAGRANRTCPCPPDLNIPIYAMFYGRSLFLSPVEYGHLMALPGHFASQPASIEFRPSNVIGQVLMNDI